MDTLPHGYSTTARLFHWVLAVLIIAMIAAGWLMVQEGLGRPLQNRLFIFHKNVGVLVGLLALARLAYRLRRPAPPLPGHIPGWQARAAAASHAALYVLMIAMPILGYVRVVAGGFPIEALNAIDAPLLVQKSEPLAEAAKTAHLWGAWAFSAILLVHFGAALQHGLLKRDGVFSRIWPPVAAKSG